MKKKKKREKKETRGVFRRAVGSSLRVRGCAREHDWSRLSGSIAVDPESFV